MPGYDSWKTRSPDDDFGEEQPSREQEEADYLDELQGPADPRGPFFSTTWEREDHERKKRGQKEQGPPSPPSPLKDGIRK